MTIYLLEIKTSLVDVSALKKNYDYVFYLRSAGYIASNKLFFLKAKFSTSLETFMLFLKSTNFFLILTNADNG